MICSRVIIIAVIALTACTQKPDKQPDTQPVAALYKRVPLKEAKKWRQRFQSLKAEDRLRVAGKMDSIRAFTIPLSEFALFLKEDADPSIDTKHKPVTVRAYFGVDSLGPKSFELKMLVVGVNSNNQDIIRGYNGLADDAAAAGDIFDLTSPCPNTCDPESPLYMPQGKLSLSTTPPQEN